MRNRTQHGRILPISNISNSTEWQYIDCHNIYYTSVFSASFLYLYLYAYPPQLLDPFMSARQLPLSPSLLIDFLLNQCSCLPSCVPFAFHINSDFSLFASFSAYFAFIYPLNSFAACYMLPQPFFSFYFLL